MRNLSLLLLLLLPLGCIMYYPDQRVVGNFRAATGEVIDINSDGRIMYISTDRRELVGLVSIDNVEPLSIRIIAPDTSPLIGTVIVFSQNRKEIKVKWMDFGDNVKRPTEFQKEKKY